MTPEDLVSNLGTLAKSGTTEFLARAESQEALAANTGNLIGAFGLGFYSRSSIALLNSAEIWLTFV
jgi:heat shock protein beta